ncbi:DUF4132 domain-containing protein [Lentzea tibetensis]|uniref:DUF4132 domain-containing protein n=1 Tax=Lentzea tibetensis TaxID=2591470 RepID=A0A563F1I5_9PSEU|nr:DUF4132 domain-containing protein [Lentzea tibetensis]TWP53598.1 DUF4132 domain-containing protein [Lentzea tibetensis]
MGAWHVRRWELVADGSAKFWEVGQEGKDVTVRFGRLQTDGQTKTKSLADEREASAHVAKLVAEKEKKGYRPVTEPAAAPPACAPDEDAFVMPPLWRKHVHPRRDRPRWSEFEVDQAAVAETRKRLEDKRQEIDEVLTEPESAPPLVAAARAWLAGEPDPLGAAAVATIVGAASTHHWIAEHGLPFAAVAALRTAEVALDWTWDQLHRQPRNRHLRPRAADDITRFGLTAQAITTVRTALADAGEAEYEAATAALEPIDTSVVARSGRAFMVPTRADWVAEAYSASTDGPWWLSPCCVGTAEELATRSDPRLTSSESVMFTVLNALGPAVAPALAAELDGPHQIKECRQLALKVLAALPTDEAFTVLLDRLGQKYVHAAAMTAMKSFPVRAARLLAPRAATDEAARYLLDAHLTEHPSLDLPEETRAALAELAATRVEIPEAPAELLPEVLVRPPWAVQVAPAAPVRQAAPIVVEGLPVPEPHLVWARGEQAEWASVRGNWDMRTPWEPAPAKPDWPALREEFLAPRRSRFFHEEAFFVMGPEEIVRPLLADWKPNTGYYAAACGQRLAAAHGMDALPPLMHLAALEAHRNGVLLMPFASAEVAALMADWLVRLKQAGEFARAWLTRHGDTAVRFLLPAALGKPGRPRKNAGAALVFLAEQGHDVVAAAAEHGDAARAAIQALVDAEKPAPPPAKLPVIGAWADPALMPRVLLRDRAHALPSSATRHLLMTAALSRPGEVHEGLLLAREVCDPVSLAEFAWAVFQRWQDIGAPAKEGWALTALGWFGDDDTVRRLTPLIRAWPGESAHAKAVTGLDVLAEIGTEVALAHLNGIAEKVKFKALKARAQEKVAAIAARLGLSRDQLADRLVPRLGLDDDASLVIDYGSRTFTVGFDEQLKPYVVDQDGKRRKELPKPGARDDQDLAVAEHKRFTTLKKDVRTVAADQIHRLEAAMVTRRQWTAAEFHTVLAAHPLLWHIVRRLVWITADGTSFRLAEDRTLADAQDDAYVLPEHAKMRVAHPVDLATEAAAWGEVFADYEILQPFPQLGRPVHAFDAGPLLPQLEKYRDVPMPVGKVLGLTKRGWVRGAPQDAGVECWITRPLPGGGALVAALDPGIAIGAIDVFPEVKFTEFWFDARGEGSWTAPRDRAHGLELDPVTASELLSELTSLHN